MPAMGDGEGVDVVIGRDYAGGRLSETGKRGEVLPRRLFCVDEISGAVFLF